MRYIVCSIERVKNATEVIPIVVRMTLFLTASMMVTRTQKGVFQNPN
jgi:hypothetical protein